MPDERIIEFDLNFIPTGVPPIVHIHQYDRGTIVTLKPTLYYGKDLYSGMDLSSCDFIVAYRRHNGSQQSYEITDHTFENDHTLSFRLDEKMSAGYGPNVMALGFYATNNANILWSQNFIIEVEKHPIQEGDLAGESAYDGMIRQFQQYIDEAFSSTPEGYEEHLAKIRQVEDDIDNLRENIRQNADEANEYVDGKIEGLSSVYQTLEDARQAALEGREYAGTLVGDLETRVLSDMALTYTTKEELNDQIVDLQVYADQVTEISATEFRQRLGLEYTEDGVDFTENGALSAEITRRADQVVQELTASFVTEDEVEGITEAYADSKITQKANEISASIQQIYETKEDANSKLLTAQSYTDSSISATSTQIRTEVNAYTDNKIRGLKIGAQNLLRGTNEYALATTEQYNNSSYDYGTWALSDGGNGTRAVFDMDDPPGGGFTVGFSILNNNSSNRVLDQGINPGSKVFTKNKVYTISGYVRVNPNASANIATGRIYFWAYKTTSATSASTCKSWAWDISKSDGWVYVEETFTVDWDVTRRTGVKFGITGAGSVDWCGCKLEEGNKATAWQPNEFDIKNYVNTSITQTNERISLLAEAQTEIDGRLSTMNSQFDVAAGKIDAMVAAGYIEPDGNNGWTSTYSTVQVNRALTEVSNRYHINENTIAALQTGIDDTGDAVTLYSRQMKSLGVENLIRATDLVTQLTSSTYSTWNQADDKYGWRAASTNSTTKTRINLAQNDRPLNNVTRAWRFVYASNATVAASDVAQDNVPMVYGKTYTISCYARCTSGSGYLHLQTWKASGSEHYKTFAMSSSANGSWQLFSFTFSHDFANYKNDTNIYFGVKNKANTACTIEICAMKLELGEVATVWCPSVFDVEAQTQAFIKVESNRITQQVNNLSGQVSQIQQTADNISLTVGNLQVGGTNLYKNSKFEENSTGHTVNGTWYFGTIDGEKCIYCDGELNTTKTVYFNPSRVVKKDEVYTLSADIYLSGAVKGTTNCFVGLYESGETIDGVWRTPTKVGGNGRDLIPLNNKGWTRVHITFKYDQDYLVGRSFRYSIWARDFTGRFAFKNVKLEKSAIPSQWSPAPEDMQEAMDGNDVITLINLSSTTATIQAKHIDLNGAVTFNSLASDAQNKINTAQSTADTAKSNAATAQSTANTANSTANTAKTNAANAQSTANTAKSTADSALSKANSVDASITAWCYNNNKTYINGGKLYTGTVNSTALNLYGELTVRKTDGNSIYGTLGYGNGNDGTKDTDGMLLKRDSSHYVFVSNEGIALKATSGRVTLDSSQVKITGTTTMDGGLTTKGATYIAGGFESNVTAGVIQVGKANTTTNIGMYSSGGMSGSGTVTRQSNGYVKVSSSNRYKKNLERYLTSEDVEPWYDLPIYYGSYKDEYMEEGDNYYHKHLPMFTVDDIEEIYPVANFHNEDGTLDNCAWDSFVIIPIMLKMIQDMKREIDALKGE